MSAKKKKTLQSLKSELHALTLMPPLLIEERLFALESEQMGVESQVLDEDHLVFEMQHYAQNGRITARIMGQLRRWQGTHTRVDANSRTYVPGEWLNYAIYIGSVLFITAWLSWIGMGILWFIVGNSGSVGTVYVVSLIIALLCMRVLPTIDLFHGQHYQAAKDVDHMMQQLANILTEDTVDAAPLLEFDGTEDSLTRLLNSTVADHVRVGSDGEIMP